MKSNSFDCPALKFIAMFYRGAAPDVSIGGLSRARLFDFSQIDGFKKSAIGWGFSDKNNKLAIVAVMDETELNNPEKHVYEMVSYIDLGDIFNVTSKIPDMEISEIVEAALALKYVDNSLVVATHHTPEEVVGTFLSRYRGKSDEQLKEIFKLKSKTK